MRTLDAATHEEIANVDLSAGYLTTMFCWVNDDGVEEDVNFFHPFTDFDIAQQDAADASAQLQTEINALPDALADLAAATADNTVDIADLQDAIVELAAVVAELMA